MSQPETRRMSNPPLDQTLDAAEFARRYWLRSELVGFCRREGITASGSKDELTARVTAHLSGQPLPMPAAARRIGGMPTVLNADTVIGPGWRCTEALRRFLEAELGRRVRFDGALRRLVHEGAGLRLGDLIARWAEAPLKAEIAPQFEYNRFVRAFRAASPGATHAAVVAAWKAYRDTPKDLRPPVASLVR